jgi:spore maturation protein SpmA
VLNAVFVALVLVSVLVAAFTGHMEAVSSSALDGAKKAVELAIGLVGALSLFLGLMRVAQDGGLLRILARLAAPVMRRLFPDVPRDHPAMSAMILNIGSNMLGLGNAATPFGIRAMQELDRLNPVKGTATNAMVLFLAINTAGLAILPTTVIALRAAAGSKDPAGIVVPTWIASGCATIVGIAAATLLAKLPRFRASEPRGALDAAASPAAALAAPDEPTRTPPRFSRWLAFVYLGALGFALGVEIVTGASTRTWSDIARGLLSYWMLPILVAALTLFGWARGVKVYESLIEGAKEGFQVALRIIPYLVAILVAVAMFRASGGLALLVSWIAPLTAPLGLPAEAVPVALLRPLSGSGAFGVMSEIVTAHGPDSPLGYLVTTMQGAADTTFYILAVYFGAIGVKRTRHAVPAGLLADAAGIAAAVAVSRVLWR